MFMRVVLFLPILFFTTSSFAQIEARQIKTINVITGVPQAAEDDMAKYTGFGDVAANVVAAVEIKRRHLEFQVRLLVTSSKERLDKAILTTNEILKVMLPQVDSKMTGSAQYYKGVEVIFLDVDFGKVLKGPPGTTGFLFKMWLLKKKLEKAIPAADLNLNFSHYPDSFKLVRINAPLAIGVEEQYGSVDMINDVYESDDKKAGDFIELASGPTSAGYILNQEKTQSDDNFAVIRNWAASQAFELNAEPLKVAIAYTSEWQATQVYIDALAAMEVTVPYVLVVKAFDALDVSKLPSNVQVVRVSGMPHEVMSALIQESFISPLVTGDISFGQALGSTTDQKTIVYEAPFWKAESAAPLRSLLAKDLGVSRKELAPLFLSSEALKKMDRSQLQELGVKLGALLNDRPRQTALHGALKRHLAGWDAIGNTLEVATGFFDPSAKISPENQRVLNRSRGKLGRGPARPLSEMLSYQEFIELLKYDVERIPELKSMFEMANQNNEDIWLAGGIVRGFLHWHYLQLQSFTPTEIRRMEMPSIFELQLPGGKDFDIVAKAELEPAIRSALRSIAAVDFFDTQTYADLALLGGATVTKAALNGHSILDPYDGFRHYYEGRLVFHHVDTEEFRRLPVVIENDYSQTTEGLRTLRIGRNMTETTIDAESAQLLREVGASEKDLLSDPVRLDWVTVALKKLLAASGNDVGLVLDLLHEYKFLQALLEQDIELPKSLTKKAAQYVRENRDKFTAEEQNLLLKGRKCANALQF